MARVAIIDDHPFFRLGAEAALCEAGHDVVASCGDCRCAIETINKADPQIVLLDQRMQPISGANILSAMRQRGDERPVIILTNELSDDALLQIMRSRVKRNRLQTLPTRKAVQGDRTGFGGRALD